MATTETRYHVVDFNGEIMENNCTLADAARAVLLYDGSSYEIRSEPSDLGPYWTLWHKRLNERHLLETVIISNADTRDAAEREIFTQVVERSDGWFGCEAFEVELWDERQRELDSGVTP